MADRLHIEMSGPRDLLVIRRFDASPKLVWAAMTDPTLMRQWLWARKAPMTVCEQDFRVGGSLRWVWRMSDGRDMGLTGRFVEIAAPHLLVHTELFDEDWTGGETVVTTRLAEVAPQTTELRMTIRYGSEKARDLAASTDMADGMEEGYARLDTKLPAFLSARQTSDFRIQAEGANTIIATRSFAAPSELVRRAHLDPALIPKWLGGPDFPMLECTTDPRPGGQFRYVWRNMDGTPLALNGTYIDVGPNRISHREQFDPDWIGCAVQVVTTFDEVKGRTHLKVTLTYETTSARDLVAASGYGEGMAMGFEDIEALFSKAMS